MPDFERLAAVGKGRRSGADEHGEAEGAGRAEEIGFDW